MSVPAPSHLLMMCIGCMEPVIMKYDPALPIVHYRMSGCRYVTCHCVIKAFIGKTDDGIMAYYDVDVDLTGLDFQERHARLRAARTPIRTKIFSDNGMYDSLEMWTGEQPHDISFWSHQAEYEIPLSDYTKRTSDPVFCRYFTGDDTTIVRLPLDPELFANQHPEAILPLHVDAGTILRIKQKYLETPVTEELRRERRGLLWRTNHLSQRPHQLMWSRLLKNNDAENQEAYQVHEGAFARWREWLIAGGSMAGDGTLPLAVYGLYYNPRHEDPNYMA